MDSIEKLDYDYLYNNKSDSIINMLHDNIEKADNYFNEFNNVYKTEFKMTYISQFM